MAVGKTTRSHKRMLWLAVIYAHTGLIQIFFRHALIKHEDSFSSVPCPVLSAGSVQRGGCRHGTFPAPSFLRHTHPIATTTQNLLPGEAGASKGWETWEHGIWGRRTSSSIPPGANRWGRERWDPTDPLRASSRSAAITAKFTQHQAPTKNKP